MKAIISIILLLLVLIPSSYANGGCIKVADDVFVQMSLSPLVPVANEKASFLFSFGNKNGLIREEINGKIRIVQNGKTLLEKDFKAKDGILDLRQEFKNPGFHEIFLEFGIGNKKYAPEDFLIEVQKEKSDFVLNILFLIAGIFIGIVLMKLIKNKKK